MIEVTRQLLQNDVSRIQYRLGVHIINENQSQRKQVTKLIHIQLRSSYFNDSVYSTKIIPLDIIIAIFHVRVLMFWWRHNPSYASIPFYFTL